MLPVRAVISKEFRLILGIPSSPVSEKALMGIIMAVQSDALQSIVGNSV